MKKKIYIALLMSSKPVKVLDDFEKVTLCSTDFEPFIKDKKVRILFIENMVDELIKYFKKDN